MSKNTWTGWDVWNVEPRLPFLVLVESFYYQQDEGVYLVEFMRDIVFNLEDDTQKWQVVWERWHLIEECCRKAEQMMALVHTESKAAQVLDTHRPGLTALLTDLKLALKHCGVRFAA